MASTELPKKYKAAVYDKPGTISTKIVELDMPEPGPGEVLIHLYVIHSALSLLTLPMSSTLSHILTCMSSRTHSGVCHSDLAVMTNGWKTLPAPTQAGQVGGHEGVGEIVKLGPGTEMSGVKMGDRVGIKWMAGVCDACEACRAGVDASCFSGVGRPLAPYLPLYSYLNDMFLKRTDNLISMRL
jgi:propanol-preferring alcohol dehydrogenase